MKEIETSPIEETQDTLQEQIRQLQEKAARKQQEEIERESEEAKVEMPLANVTLKLDKNGSDVQLEKITPGELLFLVAEHHANAGGSPITKIVPLGKSIRIDPRAERARLCRKYSARKIEKLFPGTEPVFPKSFSRALSVGIGTQLESENLLDFHVQPQNNSND